MKKFRRIWIVALILLGIALIEGLIVAYDLLRPNPEKFQLATASIELPAREIKIRPFVFEEHNTPLMQQKLNNIKAQMTDSLLNIIINQSAVNIKPEAVSDSESANAETEEKTVEDKQLKTEKKNRLKSLQAGL